MDKPRDDGLTSRVQSAWGTAGRSPWESGIAWSGKTAAGDCSHSFFNAMTGSELPIEIRKQREHIQTVIKRFPIKAG